MVAQIKAKTKFSGKIIHSVRDELGLIYVVDTPLYRSLHFDSPVEQSRLFHEAPMTLAFEYQELMIRLVSDYLFKHKVSASLTLGLGGGTLINHLYCLLPKSQHTAIELRQTVIDIAYEYFYLTEQPNIEIICIDAEWYIESCEPYDLIMVDLYDSDSMPEQFCDEAFLQQLLARKTSKGMIVFNLWSTTPEKTLKILRFCQDQTGHKTRIEKTASSGNIILSIQ